MKIIPYNQDIKRSVQSTGDKLADRVISESRDRLVAIGMCGVSKKQSPQVFMYPVNAVLFQKKMLAHYDYSTHTFTHPVADSQ